MKKKRVVVLMGGVSAEREVSLVSGEACAEALRAASYKVTEIIVGHDIGELVAALTPAPDAVFNALHGRRGEDGCVQGLLELLGIPYTHSGVLASALAMNKPAAKHLFDDAGIACPEGMTVPRVQLAKGDVMERPFVIKPIDEGSSVGVKIVQRGDNKPALNGEDFPYHDEVLVERFIPGRELTVSVMGDRPLAVTEIKPRQGFYDYETKYTEDKADHIVPAEVPTAVYDQALEQALLAHRVLGCRGVSRADFRYDDTEHTPGHLYLLEINTQPGMTPLSLVPEQAKYLGISFEEICAWMVEHARCDD